MITLAYTPFIDALPLHEAWFLLIVPMTIFLAIGYKAVRCSNMKHYPKEVVIFIVQILGVMALLAIGFTIFVNVLVPMIAPMSS
ncbi:MAG: hypothetical protein CMJ35_03440 [Phycisphaerae bacterium]|nr:hypothetical protein [Phycisphaerae bacterium]MBM90652.1 hypothetical protein [Phycisphaerae bacterium]HCT44145.1 hypothetical protein [Phycisphaerales bacterium]